MAVNPVCSDYARYESRLATFKTWSKQMYPDVESLAKAGFIYTGTGDVTSCYWCGVTLEDWEKSDNAWMEHRWWSPKCFYLTCDKLKEFIAMGCLPDCHRLLNKTTNKFSSCFGCPARRQWAFWTRDEYSTLPCLPDCPRQKRCMMCAQRRREWANPDIFQGCLFLGRIYVNRIKGHDIRTK